ncbi:MAG TPA: tetratricopeptide repeat protein [Tepidisphaeraceae bacterium]|nr:tetratricopeptide repeat protein [Tepidisphaeraceae bacterium]
MRTNGMRSLISASCLLAVMAGGCASEASRPGAVAPPPPLDPQAQLALEDIPPAVHSLPQARPMTQPDAPAPVESLALFAAARDEMIAERPAEAITLLKRAIELDPDSYELYRSLGEAYLSVSRHQTPEEIEAFENALALHPDDLHLQAILGTQYAEMGDKDRALAHLRLAVLSPDYQDDDVTATEVDYVLAPLLEQMGYDRAALDRYEALLHRIANPSFELTSDPTLAGLIDTPQPVWLEVAKLDERRGDWADALDAYQSVAAVDSSDLGIQAKIVRMLTNLGRTDEALSCAAEVVVRFGDTSDAVGLLMSVGRQTGHDPAIILRQLLAADPKNASLILALADVLVDEGRQQEAQDVLVSATATFAASDRPMVDKLFKLYLDRDQIPAAANLLVVYVAAHPDFIGDIEPMWAELLRTSRANSLRLADLTMMKVDPSAEAARQYFIWRLSDLWRRDVSARGALEAAVQIAPGQRPFAPAFRQMIQVYWAHTDWSHARKQKESDALADRVAADGEGGLAAELRGIAALADSDNASAISYFRSALALGDASPPLLLTYANALHAGGDDSDAEPILKKLVEQNPLFGEAWESLFQFYLLQQNIEGARRVVADWLAADPSSVQGRVLEADLVAESGDPNGAEQLLLKLFEDHEDDPDVISALVSTGRRTGHLEQFLDRLADLVRREPANETAVDWLVGIYAQQGRTAAAQSVLDQDRAAVSHDPDSLYQIAHLYEQVDQNQTTESVLEQVVALDATHASACNDLGYTWADEGKNLPRAEALIRVAVEQEPDNQSFLDSLGWVLYKQGKYGEADGYFQKAVGPSLAPDPVVLDHYGDVLYRLGRTSDAARQWQRSLSGLDQTGEDRNDLKDLRSSLLRKLRQNEHGEKVTVAPVAVQ